MRKFALTSRNDSFLFPQLSNFIRSKTYPGMRTYSYIDSSMDYQLEMLGLYSANDPCWTGLKDTGPRVATPWFSIAADSKNASLVRTQQHNLNITCLPNSS